MYFNLILVRVRNILDLLVVFGLWISSRLTTQPYLQVVVGHRLDPEPARQPKLIGFNIILVK